MEATIIKASATRNFLEFEDVPKALQQKYSYKELKNYLRTLTYNYVMIDKGFNHDKKIIKL